MENIDYPKIFEILDTITGLPLKRRGRRWFGACFLDGSKSERWDKVTCRLVTNGIQIFEQGKGGMTLFNWMYKYGNCGKKSDVIKKLTELSGCEIKVPEPKPEKPLRYVFPAILEFNKERIGVIKDGLFLFLEKLFGTDATIEAYRRYNVTPMEGEDGKILTTFWYVDALGRVLHDKSMLYDSETGHRDKEFKGKRHFREDLGYRAYGLFGGHLIPENSTEEAKTDGKQRIYVVESEKTAILCWLFYRKGIWLASAGKNNLARMRVGAKWTLITDRDAWEFWNGAYQGQCPRWWESYPEWECGPKDDIGDYIIYKKMNKYGNKKTKDESGGQITGKHGIMVQERLAQTSEESMGNFQRGSECESEAELGAYSGSVRLVISGAEGNRTREGIDGNRDKVPGREA